jgi:hypothetical protein
MKNSVIVRRTLFLASYSLFLIPVLAGCANKSINNVIPDPGVKAAYVLPRSSRDVYGFKGPVKHVEIRKYEAGWVGDSIVEGQEIAGAYVCHEFTPSGDESYLEDLGVKIWYTYDTSHHVTKSIESDLYASETKKFMNPDECGEYTRCEVYQAADSAIPVAVDSFVNQWNPLCQITGQKWFRNDTLFQSSEMQYYANGQVMRKVVKSASSYSEHRFTYDLKNRILEASTFDSTGMENGRMQYTYDTYGSGSIDEAISTDGRVSGEQIISKETFDSSGNCVRSSGSFYTYPFSPPGAVYWTVHSKIEYY